MLRGRDVDRELVGPQAEAGDGRAAYNAAHMKANGQGRKRVIQRRFNVGVLEAIPKRKASTL